MVVTPSYEKTPLIWMNLFRPLLEKSCPLSNILPSCSAFCTEGSSFWPRSGSGQEKGWFGVPERVLWRLSKEQGFVVVFWAKWDPIWAICMKSALELGKKFNHSIYYHLISFNTIYYHLGSKYYKGDVPVEKAVHLPVWTSITFFKVING